MAVFRSQHFQNRGFCLVRYAADDREQRRPMRVSIFFESMDHLKAALARDGIELLPGGEAKRVATVGERSRWGL